ncbi:hypothetical protein GCM10011360_17460 [Primorskyibacter flagellatus]|uniref:Uncharacterized protein n=1 Tax=Primorskyibacter flagellatus TaxID=1387277 RepID=A0A917A672_9RHOB|nr:hypothetical protein [Primorskyibacter flagellatus]GGE29907.1 hypothetical protein GCM10011360_17460 [Primorskyibacter flagellatus]
MDPVSLSLAAKAGAGIAAGASALAKSRGEKEQAEINAFTGRTRAIQTDTASRQGLESELGSLRAAMGANGQAPSVGTFEMVNELRATRDRERRINFGNRMSEAADWRMAGKNAASAGKWGFAGGLVQAGPSLFDLYQYKRKT